MTDLYQTVKFHFEEEERPQSESDRKGKGETKFFRLSRDFFYLWFLGFFLFRFPGGQKLDISKLARYLSATNTESGRAQPFGWNRERNIG